MFGASDDPKSVACWARAAEISALIAPVLDAPRSATLLSGDSGIGKTTVLSEARDRLAALPGIRVGYHETFPSDNDPLLRALNNLLSCIYTVPGSADQIRIAWQNLKGKASLSGVQDFLLAAVKVMPQAAGLGLFAKGGVAALGVAAEKARGLDARITDSLLPRLGFEEFRDLLQILQAALPDATFVFIIDNLSAPAEALTADTRGFGSVDAIHAFLAQSLPSARNVHFILSWKITQATEKIFRTLRQVILQYGGRSMTLGPLADANGLHDWLAAVFPWFDGLTPGEQSEIAGISGGLPEIVAAWRDGVVGSYDPRRLRQIAEDIRGRRYLDLEEALDDAPASDRALLLSAALIRHPMALVSLAEMNDRSPQDCMDALRKWEQTLLRRASANSAGVVFDFQHEKKRDAVLKRLPETFADLGASVDANVYRFLLGHFASATDADPFADLYLNDAIELALRSGHTPNRRVELSGLAALRVLVSSKGEALAEARWDQAKAFLRNWPRNLQALFFVRLLTQLAKNDIVLAAMRIPGMPEVVDGWHHEARQEILGEASAWLRTPHQSPPAAGGARAEAAALSRLIGLLARYQRSSDIECIVSELLALKAKFPADPGTTGQVANGLAFALTYYADLRLSDDVVRLLRELRSGRDAFPHLEKPAECLAAGLSGAVACFGSLDHLDRAASVLSELQELRILLPRNETIAEHTAAAQAGMCFDSGRLREPRILRDQLERLRRGEADFPENSRIAERSAAAHANATATYGRLGQRQEFEQSLEQVRSAQNSFPAGIAIAVEYSKALYNGVTFYGLLRNSAAVDPLLTELGRLHESFSGDEYILEQLAKATVNSIGNSPPGEGDRVRRLMDQLRTLQESAPDQAMAAEQLARGALNAITYFGRDGDHGMTSSLVGDLRALKQGFSRNPAVCEWVANALAWAVVSYAAVNNPSAIDTALAEVRDIRRVIPDSRAVATQAGRAIVNALRFYSTQHNVPVMTSLLEELRSHGAAFPEDAGFARQLAQGLVNAVAFASQNENEGYLEQALSELRALQRGAPDDDAIAEALAGAILNAGRHYSKTDSARTAVLADEVSELVAQHPGLAGGRLLSQLVPPSTRKAGR